MVVPIDLNDLSCNLNIADRQRVKNANKENNSIKARLQPFTVLFFFSLIFVCFIHAQIQSFFHLNLSVNKTNKDQAEKKKYRKRL